MNKRTLGVVAVFLVGCAVGGVSSQIAVPKASAQQAALPAWEYLCTYVPTAGEGDATAVANKLAAQRWELASVIPHAAWCWKRPKT
jgi:hypothetical protein